MNVVIVNDCSNYFVDTLPLLKKQYPIKMIHRSRGLVDKIFGVALKILKAKGSIFTVNYALQDAWLVRKLKHLDLLFCHGSDVRTTLNTRKYGWIVKGNLKHAAKVAYSTPDLYEYIEPYAPEAEYIPVPVNTEIFTPAKHSSDTVNALWFYKWYETIPQEAINLCSEYNINLTLMGTTVPYSQMPNHLRRFQIYFDRQTIPSRSKTCLEAMSCGLATITYRDNGNMEERLADLSDPKACRREGQVNRRYAEEFHSKELTANKIANLWDSFG